jgi:hypothetical protein
LESAEQKNKILQNMLKKIFLIIFPF